MNGISREILSEKDFQACSIWRYDYDENLYYSLNNLDIELNSLYDLEFRCDFETKNGKRISGSVCGVENIYFIRLFLSNDYYTLNNNRNAESLFEETMAEVIRENPQLDALHWRALFPLKFQTNLNHSEVKDFSGIFDIQRESE